MTDSYIEVIVHDEKDMKGKQFNMFLLFLTLVSLIYGMMFMSIIGLIVGFVLIPVTVSQVKNRYREYEYLIVADEMDISVVKNHKRRKKIQTFSLGDLQCMAPARSPQLEGFHGHPQLKTYNYSSGNPDHAIYCMIFSKQGTPQEVIVEPTQAMLDCIRERCMGVLVDA